MILYSLYFFKSISGLELLLVWNATLSYVSVSEKYKFDSQ